MDNVSYRFIQQLERIGDRATNLAESVILQATGKVVNLD